MTEPVDNSKETPEAGAGDILKTDEQKAAEAKAISDKTASDKASADAKAAEDAKKKDEPSKEKKVPESYALKLPEGSKLDASHVEKIATFAKERGLSQEDAQAMLDRDSQLRADFETQGVAQLDEAAQKWAEDSKSDKEIGGEEFQKNAELAKRVIERFATPEFKAQINKTGFGNHPELVRIFVRIGKAMSDDQFVQPGSQTQETTDVAKKFYGDSTKKE